MVIDDEQNTLLGDLNQIGSTVSIESYTEYKVLFIMGGYDTLTTQGTQVFWNIQLTYSMSSSTAVPGFGGLALFGGTIALRRRRRR